MRFSHSPNLRLELPIANGWHDIAMCSKGSSRHGEAGPVLSVKYCSTHVHLSQVLRNPGKQLPTGFLGECNWFPALQISHHSPIRPAKPEAVLVHIPKRSNTLRMRHAIGHTWASVMAVSPNNLLLQSLFEFIKRSLEIFVRLQTTKLSCPRNELVFPNISLLKILAMRSPLITHNDIKLDVCLTNQRMFQSQRSVVVHFLTTAS